MNYDFSTIIDRSGTYSMKWDVAEGELPMWVADMEFQAAPEIRAAIAKRAEHGVFGYTVPPEAWYEAYIGWWRDRHGFSMEREWLTFTTGVIPAISTAVRQLTAPGEGVVVLSPVYNHFYVSIEDNQRRAVESPLICEDGAYRVDFDDLESRLADKANRLLVFSNPHNPTGNLWDRETLARVGALCDRYDVPVVADEIHCDLTDPGLAYVPFASVSEACARRSITCIAPTKAFNIAGLQTAAICVPDQKLRRLMKKGLDLADARMPGAFAIDAAIAAFTQGGPWLDALREYLYENKKTVKKFLKEHLPLIGVSDAPATYLMWLDFSCVSDDGSRLCRWIRQETGLYLSAGEIFRGDGPSHARLNIACPREMLKDGLGRLARGVETYRDCGYDESCGGDKR